MIIANDSREMNIHAWLVTLSKFHNYLLVGIYSKMKELPSKKGYDYYNYYYRLHVKELMYIVTKVVAP